MRLRKMTAAAGLFLCVAVFFAEEAEPKSEVDRSLQKNFVIIESEGRHDLNPQTTSFASDSQVLNGLYEGLFSYNPVTLEPQFAIATDYRISRDKKRWTFTLRDNARFSNGEKITAQNVKDSWLQLLSTQGAPFASLLDVISGAQEFREGKIPAEKVGIYVNSENSLSVHLTKPANYLVRLLCHSAFSVVHRSPTVYSGAFYLADQNEKSLVLKKNPYYWDAAITYLEQITFIQSNDGDENAFLFNTGAADWISNTVTTEKLINTSAVQFSAEFGTSYFFFKTSAGKPSSPQKFNAWDYPEFRSAVLEALPWEQLRSKSMIKAATFVYPLYGYPNVEGFSYTDLAEAKNLMREARAKYGVPEDALVPLVFEITEYTLGSAEAEQAIADALVPLGIDFQIRKIPPQEYLYAVPRSDADLFSYTWIGDFADPLAFLELFHGNSSLNDSGWKNDEFDGLLEQAALCAETDRYGILAQAERILLDSGMVIPIDHPVSFNVVDLDVVGGWSVNEFDLHPLKYLYKKSKKVEFKNLVQK